jgi:hypothetical protein
VQSQRDYLPSLDLSTNQAKQPSKFNKLPLVSKLFWLLFSVPRLLLGWMVRVCCQVLLCAWCDRLVRLLSVFCIVNKKSPHYDMSNDFSGKIQHITKYVKSGVSYRTYEKNHMDSQVAIF